jgi:site-specific DNA-cytosine methylase
MTDDVREIRHFHMACGLGGGARGFNMGQARVGSMVAKFRCIGGIDVDKAAITDFDKLSGVHGTVMDLFSRDQYVAFHGREPPEGWVEATTADIHRAAGGERPHIVFSSFPCKGFSGLLSEKTSGGEKYQALNALTLRGMWLVLEAWADDPVELLIFENVPRIATRGRWLLDQITSLLRHYGYAYAETKHNCGELGGLSQSRERFLLVARHREKVPPFLYEAPKRPLRGVGEVLDRLWLPGDERGGPMHRVPKLQWKTWVRLAFVEAGSDWRSLNKLAIEDGQLRDFGIVPEAALRNGAYGVLPYETPAGTVQGESLPSNGTFAVADPRAVEQQATNLGVTPYDKAAGTVKGRSGPTNGAFAVADPRAELWGTGQGGVTKWEEPAPTVTTQRSPLQGKFSVADPRIDGHERSIQHGVGTWDKPAAVIKGDVSVGTGRYAVADPRMEGPPRFNNVYRIVPWAAASPAVAGPGGPAGGLAVADPRPSQRTDYKQNKYRVTKRDEPAGSVIAASTTGNGAFAVADPIPEAYGQHANKMRVEAYDAPAHSVTGSDRVGSGALSVADPRPEAFKEGRPGYNTQRHYGVLGWGETSGGVTASGQADNGAWSVADPRMPVQTENLVCVIRSLDGTWHRPFTTLELAALQSLFDPEDGFELTGSADSMWRERIGNAVPSAAAAAIASTMGRTLLLAWSGESFMLSTDAIWVRPLEIALAVDTSNQLPVEW